MPTLTKPQLPATRPIGPALAGPVAGVAFAGAGLALADLTPLPGPVQALAAGVGGLSVLGGVLEEPAGRSR